MEHWLAAAVMVPLKDSLDPKECTRTQPKTSFSGHNGSDACASLTGSQTQTSPIKSNTHIQASIRYHTTIKPQTTRMSINHNCHPYQSMPPLDSLEWIQGSASSVGSSPYKLGLLFQANCPGCHTHAIPTANQLWTHVNADKTSSPFDVYAISTAFEDFEYNTAASTRLLVEQGRRVGIVQEQLGPVVASCNDAIPHMPVAYDTLVPKAEASPELLNQAVTATVHNARQQLEAMRLPTPVLEQALEQLLTGSRDHFVAHALPEQLARTFYAVAAPGTPTWILHHADGRVVDRRFGNGTADELEAWIQERIAGDKAPEKRSSTALTPGDDAPLA